MGRSIVAALLAFAAMVPAPGHGAEMVIAIRGYVPVVCRVALSGGTLHEFCNSGSGYRVYAAPSPELVGATLVVDGVRKPLSSGETLLSSSSRPGITDRTVAIEGGPGGSISFRIEAI